MVNVTRCVRTARMVMRRPLCPVLDRMAQCFLYQVMPLYTRERTARTFDTAARWGAGGGARLPLASASLCAETSLLLMFSRQANVWSYVDAQLPCSEHMMPVTGVDRSALSVQHAQQL